MPGTFDGRIAFASIRFTAPGAPAFRTQSGDFASVAVVGGVTRLTFQDPIAPYQGFPSLTLRTATGGYASIVDWTSTYLDVETLDTTGAAAEIEFDLTVVQQTVSFVVPPAPPPPPLAPPTDQLGAWYRADDLSQPNGSTVVAWPDRSGNGADLVPTPGASPTLDSAVVSLGNQSAVQMTGAQQLARTSPPGYAGGNSGYSLYVVHEPVLDGTTTIPSVAFGWGGTGVPNDRLTMFIYQFGGQWVCGMESEFAGSGGRLIPFGGQIYNASLAQNGVCAQTVVTVNGVILPDVDGAGGGPLALPSPVSAVTLGHFPLSFGPNGYKGKIAEILYYSKQHSPAERAQTLAYLSDRYSIPVP